MPKESRKIFLLAPAGGHEALSAALANGADAVYFGVGDLNMRSHATVNFRQEELPELAAKCHAAGAEAWLTVNVIVYDTELQRVEELLVAAKDAGIDAIIAADPAVLRLAHDLDLPVHLSVQANVSNWQTVAFYAPYVDVVVAARELTCEQLSGVVQNIEAHDIRGPSGELVRVEAFVHGALCIGLSGRCGMSLCEYNTSSNRGNCYQPCRRAYLVKDAETGQEFQIQNQYIMSPKDLCTIAQLPKLLDAGVGVLKIEGRGRSADYVATTTRVYRKALEAWQKGDTPSVEQIADWRGQLLEVFNRRFWEGGYYLGEQTDIWAGTRDNQSTIRKEFLGVVTHYYPRPQVAEVLLQSGNLRVGQKVLITGATTGAVEFEVPSMQVLEKPAEFAGPGADVCIPLATKVRPNDKLFALKSR
ncbi:MAG: U32 family peptidase [Victivallales bacterium]|nr:U32 family peptidase [Victivallales bacterium]